MHKIFKQQQQQNCYNFIFCVLFFFFYLQSLTEDVERQTEREKQLQKQFAELQDELRTLDPNNELLTH